MKRELPEKVSREELKIDVRDVEPLLSGPISQLTPFDHDSYDIVGARVYQAVLAWLRNRLKDVYTIVGVIDGQLAGFANARKRDDEVHISLHSMSYMRGGRVGAAMCYDKAQYAFDVPPTGGAFSCHWATNRQTSSSIKRTF